jgi:hypothetical protein
MMVALAPRVAVLHEGGAHLVHSGDLGPGIVYVGEDHGRAAEHTVLKGDAFVDEPI